MNSQYSRKVMYETIDGFVVGRQVQKDYMDMTTGWLIPNTELKIDNKITYKINSLGCKGNELIEGVPVIGYFGDSGSFGGTDCWPDKVSVTGTQNLNASVEGHSMNWVIKQYLRLKSGGIDFVAGVFYTGWHNIIYNETTEEYWRSQLDLIDDLDIVALCTPHCCLTEEYLERVIEDLLSDDPNSPPFYFFGSVPWTEENTINVYQGIRRFNKFLKSYCLEKDYIFIDLDSLLKPPSYDQIPDIYSDVCHTHYTSNEKIGAFVTNAIEKKIQTVLRKRKARSPREIKKQLPSADDPAANFDTSNEIYSKPWWSEPTNAPTNANVYTQISQLEHLITLKNMTIEGLETKVKRQQDLHTELLRRQLSDDFHEKNLL